MILVQFEESSRRSGEFIGGNFFVVIGVDALAANSGAFQDVVSGDNAVAPAPAYSAKSGWDACAGLGTPNGTKLLAALKL